MAQCCEASIFALEEVWGAGSKPGGATFRFLIFVGFFFFFSSYFYPLVCFCLFSLLTLFSFARFLRISSLREHGGGFSFGGDPELTVSPLNQISSVPVFISNCPRSSEHSSLLHSLPFLTLCLSLVMTLSSCFTGREQGLVACSRPAKGCAFSVGRVSWFG